jgi:hypothetical protein
MAGNGSRTLKLSILADVDNLKKGLADAGDTTDGFGTKLGSFAKGAGIAFAAAGAAALAYAGTALVEATKNAIADEEAQKNLALTLQNTTKATDAQIAAVEDYITQTSLSKGITDDVLRPAFERLSRSTKSTEESQKLLNIALDVSTATGKPLETVANALGKAYDGNAAALGKLGLGIDSNILKSGDMNKITTALAENFGGFASQRAETFSGKMDRLKIAFDEGKETIGGFVLDAITPLVTLIVEKVVPTISNLSDKIGTGLSPIFKDITDFVKDSVIPVFTELWDYFTKNIVPLFKSYAELLSVTLLPAIKALWGFVQDFLVPIFKATLTPVIEGLNTVFKKLKGFIEDNNAVFTFLGAVIGVIGGAAKILAPIIGTTLGLAFKGVGLIIDGVSLAISGVVAGINLAIAAVNLLIKAYNAVNNLFGGKDITEIPTIILSKGAKAAAVTPAAAQAVKDEIAKEVGDVAKQVAKETAAITKTAAAASAATASAVVKDELAAGLGGTTGNIGEAMFAIRQAEAGYIPPVAPTSTAVGEAMFRIRQMESGNIPPTTINVNVSGAIDQEGTARTIVDTLNNSFYRGTNGARALVT